MGEEELMLGEVLFSVLCWAAVLVPFCFCFFFEPKPGNQLSPDFEQSLEEFDGTQWLFVDSAGLSVLWGDYHRDVRSQPNGLAPS
eukprot:176894-Rhodomonas_salina.1